MIETGTFLGERYEIVERIGTGGMADVYKSKDHKLNRFVAVKVLKDEFRDDKAFVSKFQAEAQSAAGLMHPNIVSVYDVGEEGPLHYIVMELIEGITLKEYIRKKSRLGYKEAISIAIQVCSGIQVAHNQGIIHRDIKPHNIMISKDGKVKVTDFGIAKATSSNTISSNAMGSVHYTSPEQARGGYSDAKSDIYSLGITIYEMVTGKVPFDGDTTVAIAIKHLQEEIIPPSEYVEDIPASLEQIIIKCTQKGSDRRYASMEEVIKDLKESLVNPEGEFVNLIPINNNAETVMIGDDDLSKIKETTGTIMFDLDDEEEFDDFDEDGEDDYDDDEDEDVNPKITKIMKILRIVMAVIIACIILFLIGRATNIFNFGDKDKEKEEEEVTIEVPGVVGKKEAEAKKILEDEGLKMKTVEVRATEEYEEGVVIEQTPGEGEEAAEGDTIEVVISKAPEEDEVVMPSLVGKTQSEAEAEIRALDYNLSSEPDFEFNDSYASGTVIRTNPSPGATLTRGGTITLVVSKGPEIKKVSVPDLYNDTEAGARSKITSAGLQVGTVSQEYHDTIEEGRVIRQSPEAGGSVDEGTAISFVISRGKENKTETKLFDVDIKGLAGYVGINIKLEMTRSDNGEFVWSQEYKPFPEGIDGYTIRNLTLTVDQGVTSVAVKVDITNLDDGTVTTKNYTLNAQ